MSEDVSEDECVICGHWPEKDRWAVREMIEVLPLQENTCVKCEAVFFQGSSGPARTTRCPTIWREPSSNGWGTRSVPHSSFPGQWAGHQPLRIWFV